MKSYFDWQSSLQTKIGEINQRLLDSISTDQKELYEMSKYTIEAGGKRFRPLLTILVYGIVTDEPYSSVLDLAAGYELIHTASLIHDDIIDRAELRRGRKTLNSSFGMENAIVVGDYLFAKAYELGSRYGTEVSKIMADGSSRLAEGQTLEFVNRGNLKISEQTYLNIIAGKTAHFFEACAMGAAVAASGTFDIVEHLSQFAFNLGMAFQVTDDVLDFISSEETEGKPVLHDIRESTITLPVIHAMKVSEEAAIKIEKILTDESSSQDELKKLLVETGSIEYSFNVANEFIQKAVSSLQKTGRSPNLNTLMDLAMIVIDRISSIT